MGPNPHVDVSADPRTIGGCTVFVGCAHVRYERPDGRTESAYFQFENHPFPTQAEAEAYARRAALLRVLRVLPDVS